MKKIYINPMTVIVKIQPHCILVNSIGYNSLSVDAANADSRRGSFIFDDEDED